jgi:exonuclease III
VATHFWSGKHAIERRESGVAFAIRNSIAQDLEQDPTPINDRIITLRLPLQKNCFVTIVCVYAPTLTNPEGNKEEFYSVLRDTIKTVPATDKLIIADDLNAHVGAEAENWPGVIGSHGVGKCNSNGEL